MTFIEPSARRIRTEKIQMADPFAAHFLLLNLEQDPSDPCVSYLLTYTNRTETHGISVNLPHGKSNNFILQKHNCDHILCLTCPHGKQQISFPAAPEIRLCKFQKLPRILPLKVSE